MNMIPVPGCHALPPHGYGLHRHELLAIPTVTLFEIFNVQSTDSITQYERTRSGRKPVVEIRGGETATIVADLPGMRATSV